MYHYIFYARKQVSEVLIGRKIVVGLTICVSTGHDISLTIQQDRAEKTVGQFKEKIYS